MTIYGKSVSQYVRFQKPILGLIVVVGVVRLALSLAGVSPSSVKFFSLTVAWLIGLVAISILVHTRGFGGFKELLPLVAIQSLVSQVIAAGAIALAIGTGRDNIFSIPEYSGGVDGKTWGHAGAHLVIATVVLTIGGWLIGSIILYVTQKLKPTNQGNPAPRGKARAAGA